MTSKYRLYGIAGSLYTAKARSYLRKQNIDFVEFGPNHPDYGKRIIPMTRPTAKHATRSTRFLPRRA